MPFISSMAAGKGGRIFPLGAKPAVIGLIALTAGDATDTFSWSAPQNNGLAITKYGYQTTTDNGLTWNPEVEVLTNSAVINTQYSLNSFKIRVRSFNAAGWSDYSNISTLATVAWTNNTGTQTETDTDTACGPAGCSSTDTATEGWSDACAGSCYEGQYCNCGAQYRYRTRSRSRSMSRTSSRTRTRTRSTQFYSRSGSTSSSITYGSWSAYSSYTDYTYSAWSYGAFGDWTYSAFGNWSACDNTGTYVPQDIYGSSVTCSNGITYEGTIFGYLRVPYARYSCPSNDYLEAVDGITRCSTTGTYFAGNTVCVIPSCC